MTETAKKAWGIVSCIIALAFAAGFAYWFYLGNSALPYGYYLTENIPASAALGVVLFAIVWVVLYKGIHPY